jgi:hypothetical protein
MLVHRHACVVISRTIPSQGMDDENDEIQEPEWELDLAGNLLVIYPSLSRPRPPPPPHPQTSLLSLFSFPLYYTFRST